MSGCRLIRVLILALLIRSVAGSHVNCIRQQQEGLVIDVCLPPQGIAAGEPIELFVKITRSAAQASGPPLTAGAGVPGTLESSRITMPAMATMPPIVPTIRWLGYPGSYALKTSFPHGGFYRIGLTYAPSPGTKRVVATCLFEVLDERMEVSALPKPYLLRVKSDPAQISAGKTARLSLSLWSREENRLVSDFEIVHEKQLHLILVREDLGLFFHEHPELQADGKFSLTFKFPTAGRWNLFADMAPRGAGQQVALCSVTVEGAPYRREALVPAAQPVIKQDDLTLTMQPAYLVAGRAIWLSFRLEDGAGHPPSGLEAWLGAPAHLILISNDTPIFVHSHPEPGDEQASRDGTLIFQARFPRPGVYKGWVQFQRSGQLFTLPFVLQVAER
jgi:hypothetical protein